MPQAALRSARRLARAALIACAVAGGVLPSRPLFAAAAIEVSPTRLDFPMITLGDTASTSFNIKNRGDAVLTISGFDLPPGTELSMAAPFDVAPASSVRVDVGYAPTDTAGGDVALTIHSNDPVNPALSLPWDPDVRPLAIEVTAFTTGDRYPLGEAIVVQCVPIDKIHIEKATLLYRSGTTRIFQSLPMVLNNRTFIALIPGESVKEGGVEYYVHAENDTFWVDEPALGPERPARVDVESPHEFKLDAIASSSGFNFPAGRNIDFMLTLTRGTVFRSGILHYRVCGDSAYQQTSILEISFTGVSASIPGTLVGPRGVEYWAEITTLTQRLTLPRAGTQSRASQDPSKPIQLRVRVETLAEPVTHAGGRYRMLSVPLELQPGTGLSAILSDEDAFGSYDPMRWRAFRYLPARQANVELSPAEADAFAIQAGRAFWLVSRDGHRVTTAPVPGASTLGGDVFPIVLEPGWNQFGNPFAFPVPWAQVRGSGALGEPVAYDSDRGDYSDAAVTQLDPFSGYFIENATGIAETLYVPPIAVDSARTPLLPGPDLVASLRLEARSPHGADLANRIGVAAGASPERDDGDRAKPPPAPGAAVRLSLANRGWRDRPGLYRRDIRSAGAEGNTWEIEITSAEGADPVELTLRSEGTWPAGTVLRLVDREQGSFLDVDPKTGVWRHDVLAFGARPYRLALLAGTAEYVRAGGASLPARLVLDPASPNPSRGAQRLRFGLPRAATARLEVFDASGRRVATLVDGAALPAGYHSVLWQPGRDGSAGASSGIYFYRLTVDGEVRTARSVMVR